MIYISQGKPFFIFARVNTSTLLWNTSQQLISKVLLDKFSQDISLILHRYVEVSM